MEGDKDLFLRNIGGALYSPLDSSGGSIDKACKHEIKTNMK